MNQNDKIQLNPILKDVLQNDPKLVKDPAVRNPN